MNPRLTHQLTHSRTAKLPGEAVGLAWTQGRRFARWSFGEGGVQLGGLATPITYSRAGNATVWDADPKLVGRGDNVMRIDHDPATGELIGLLGESEKVNTPLQSEDFSTWTPNNCTVSVSATSAPRVGSQCYDLASTDTAANRGYLTHATTGLTGAATVTVSVFVKKGHLIRLQPNTTIGGTVSGITLNFNTATNAVTGAGSAYGNFSYIGAGIIDCGVWCRVFVTFGVTGTMGSLAFWVFPHIVTGGATQTATIFGAQAEAGGLSSYIPTSGSQATRQGDTLTTPTTWFDPSGGIFLAKVRVYPGSIHTGIDNNILSLGAGVNIISLRLRRGANGNITVVVGSGSDNSFLSIGGAPSAAEWEYLALVYSTTNGSFLIRKTGSGVAAASTKGVNYSGNLPAQMTLFQNLNGHDQTLEYQRGQFATAADAIAVLNQWCATNT